jgi:hypothetical protein
MHFGPELNQVNYQKDQNKSTENAHVSGCPSGRIFIDRISFRTSGFAVILRQQDRPEYVDENSRVVNIRYRLNQRVAGHELGVDVKSLASIMFEELEISDQVNY